MITSVAWVYSCDKENSGESHKRKDIRFSSLLAVPPRNRLDQHIFNQKCCVFWDNGNVSCPNLSPNIFNSNRIGGGGGGYAEESYSENSITSWKGCSPNFGRRPFLCPVDYEGGMRHTYYTDSSVYYAFTLTEQHLIASLILYPYQNLFFFMSRVSI